ncbi:MAG TPA: NUDIX-like domain-containing protein, partial [Candidatus Dormibacteraeota bacterium]|nr:NUDIX-like domain-containing protein [Candidatus Dormibacteraeota bacterium]
MTPLSVYLPFNMECLRGEFEPAKRGGGPPTGVGRWLVVQDQKLLVVPEGDGFRLPAGESPEAPPRGLEGLGPRHWLGTWGGAPCWVAARPKDAPVPEGLA